MQEKTNAEIVRLPLCEPLLCAFGDAKQPCAVTQERYALHSKSCVMTSGGGGLEQTLL